MAANNSEFNAGRGPVYHGEGLADVASGSWRIHSFGHGDVDETAPGAKWGSQVALVPVKALMPYRQLDRTSKHALEGYSSRNIDKLTDELRNGGVNAIREPLFLGYSHEDRWGTLGEGHHRLEAAIRAGVTHLPVTILRSTKPDFGGAPLHLDNRIVEKNGYYPGNLHPGNFQEFEGAR